MNNQVKRIFMILLAVLLIGAGIFIGANSDRWFGEKRLSEKSTAADVDENAEDYTGNKDTYTGEKNTDTIDIPGFDRITFQADTKEQSVNLYNPEKNSCYFKMTILLSDGTALWESKLIEPGKAIYHLTLNQEMQVGEYKDCTLKYECFAMDEQQTPLNGSEIKFTLNVLK